MPRIALLADIHANLPALDAVIADIAAQHVDEIIVAGDLVGRGPQGSAVVRRIRALGWPCVRGNHEDYLINIRRGRFPSEWRGRQEWDGVFWMANELGQQELAFIESLPFHMTSQLAPQVHIYHGTPASNQEGIGHWTQPERLHELAAEIPGEVMITAHTHRSLKVREAGMLFVNVGSVGLPFNGDWRAQYVVLSGEDGAWEAEFRCVEWDRDDFLKTYERSGFLREGTITSVLLRQEVLTARPHLVPFTKWAAHMQRVPCLGELEAFMDFYDPSLSMEEHLARLEAGQEGS